MLDKILILPYTRSTHLADQADYRICFVIFRKHLYDARNGTFVLSGLLCRQTFYYSM
jgi:hypothetical protein